MFTFDEIRLVLNTKKMKPLKVVYESIKRVGYFIYRCGYLCAFDNISIFFSIGTLPNDFTPGGQ